MQKRVARWLMGGVILCAVGAGTLLLIPHEKLLLAKAHKTALPAAKLDYERGAWRSDHEQLLLRGLEDTDYFGVFTRDINTDTETPLEPFNTTSAPLLKAPKSRLLIRRFPRMQSGGLSQFMLPPIHAFSPDGKWLLWGDDSACRAIPLFNTTAATEANAKVWQRRPTKYRENHVYWLNDSRHWIEVLWDSQFYVHGIILHDLDAPENNVTKTFSSRGSRWPLGITSDNHLFSYESNIPPPFPSLTYYDTPLNAPQPVSRKITIPLPSGTTARMILSPDGTRLLWRLRVETHLSGPTWMQAVCARLGMQPRVQHGLWISRRDGSDLHEIGHITEKPLKPQSGTPIIVRQAAFPPTLPDLFQEQWLPDSRHVLFASGNDVYTVDVD